jgi:hypothetical protein
MKSNRIKQESQEKESGRNRKKKERSKKVKRKKNQARSQEHKNLAWRGDSCLSRQDSVYMDLA